jgi:hypothetical protein
MRNSDCGMTGDCGVRIGVSPTDSERTSRSEQHYATACMPMISNASRRNPLRPGGPAGNSTVRKGRDYGSSGSSRGPEGRHLERVRPFRRRAIGSCAGLSSTKSRPFRPRTSCSDCCVQLHHVRKRGPVGGGATQNGPPNRSCYARWM